METLKQSRDFDSIYSRGAKWHTPSFIVFFRTGSECRVGFTVSKKVGNAVERNFARRRLRVLYKRCSQLLKTGTVVVVAKNQILETSFSVLESDFLHALKRLKAIE
ncbi:MAG: ribonuclease P protein component [Wolinella sp.]